MEIDHRLLDHVRGTALDHRVDRQPFAECSQVPVVGMDFGDRTASPQHRRHVAVLLGLADAGLHELRDSRVALLVFVDEFRRLGARDAESAGKSEGALPVDDAEVDGLGPASLFPGDLVLFDPLDLGSDKGVDVLVGIEGFLEPLVF